MTDSIVVLTGGVGGAHARADTLMLTLDDRVRVAEAALRLAADVRR